MGLHKGEDSTLSRVEEVLVNDGDWHHLQLDISSLGGAASHHKAVLSLDQGLYLVSCCCILTALNHHELHFFCSHKVCIMHLFRPVWMWTGSCETPS